MARVFAYCRVSTAEQTTENQLQEIEGAGFRVEPHRAVVETVSGSVVASERQGFRRLRDKMESGDVLVVTKLDRLGRNAMDVRSTVADLEAQGVRVHCLQLGGADLTSPAGKMVMTVLGAVAEFERDLLIERTQSGLARARSQGKRLGRKPKLDPVTQEEVLVQHRMGESLGSLAKRYNISRSAIQRIGRRAAAGDNGF